MQIEAVVIRWEDFRVSREKSVESRFVFFNFKSYAILLSLLALLLSMSGFVSVSNPRECKKRNRYLVEAFSFWLYFWYNFVLCWTIFYEHITTMLDMFICVGIWTNTSHTTFNKAKRSLERYPCQEILRRIISEWCKLFARFRYTKELRGTRWEIRLTYIEGWIFKGNTVKCVPKVLMIDCTLPVQSVLNKEAWYFVKEGGCCCNMNGMCEALGKGRVSSRCIVCLLSCKLEYGGCVEVIEKGGGRWCWKKVMSFEELPNHIFTTIPPFIKIVNYATSKAWLCWQFKTRERVEGKDEKNNTKTQAQRQQISFWNLWDDPHVARSASHSLKLLCVHCD